jgi:hypothetical protein
MENAAIDNISSCQDAMMHRILEMEKLRERMEQQKINILCNSELQNVQPATLYDDQIHHGRFEVQQEEQVTVAASLPVQQELLDEDGDFEGCPFHFLDSDYDDDVASL